MFSNSLVTERSGGDCCSLWVFSGVLLSCSHDVPVGDRHSKSHSGLTDPQLFSQHENSSCGVLTNGPKAKASSSLCLRLVHFLVPNGRESGVLSRSLFGICAGFGQPLGFCPEVPALYGNIWGCHDLWGRS